ncbi:hypothetical protein EDF80_104218 [Pseudomonas brenneri]|jgi:ABC-type uncharacterized transport system fused permease/ATPase subunit|nr:hypothetical protein EDF80_104218 [Pseudomonas brenneri]SEE70027.1 hypothetical protein SAMN04490200_5234 [Pseudomonas proteolytica]
MLYQALIAELLGLSIVNVGQRASLEKIKKPATE